jgi:hypothetical protein
MDECVIAEASGGVKAVNPPEKRVAKTMIASRFRLHCSKGHSALMRSACLAALLKEGRIVYHILFARKDF